MALQVHRSAQAAPLSLLMSTLHITCGSTMGTLRLMDNSNDQVLWSKTGGSGFSYYAYWKYATNVPAGTTQIRLEYLRGAATPETRVSRW